LRADGDLLIVCAAAPAPDLDRHRPGLNANATAIEEVGLKDEISTARLRFTTLPALPPRRSPRTSINQMTLQAQVP
jgi:hypothetical protein